MSDSSFVGTQLNGFKYCYLIQNICQMVLSIINDGIVYFDPYLAIGFVVISEQIFCYCWARNGCDVCMFMLCCFFTKCC